MIIIALLVIIGMKKHLEGHSEDRKKYVCEQCGKTYFQEDSLLKHLKFHAEGELIIRRFKCEHEGCTSAFILRSHLRKHVRAIHEKLKPYLCPHCGKDFAYQGSYSRHLLTQHTENPQRQFQCHLCDKAFFDKNHLQAHLQTKSHGGPGPKKRKPIPGRYPKKTWMNAEKSATETSVPIAVETGLTDTLISSSNSLLIDGQIQN
jgi:uncharacterized Zn-finger protein